MCCKKLKIQIFPKATIYGIIPVGITLYKHIS